jgi:hypothetical protein
VPYPPVGLVIFIEPEFVPKQIGLVEFTAAVNAAGSVSVITWQVASTVNADVVLLQFVEVLVKVNVAVPAVEPAVITPAFVIVAIEGLLLAHVPPLDGDAVAEPPMHIELELKLTVGKGVNVTTVAAEEALWQPAALVIFTV